MVIGTQHLSGDNWTQYQTLAQLGVRHVSANPPGDWRTWTAPVLSDFKARLAEQGEALDMLLLPLSSAAAPLNGAPHVFLGPPAERDRELDQICELIRNLALAGVHAARYNAAFLGHFRTPDRLGRGGARLSSFVYDQLNDPRSGPGELDAARRQREQAAWALVAEQGPHSVEECWERIDTFLARVVPVAEEYQVRLACHPEDPGIGDRTYMGLPRVLGTVDGLKKLIELHPSPYHGLNFCVGTIGEMLEHPAEEIGDIVRYFGARGKIFNIHFRNIRGGLWNFVETFPDEGDMNMRAVLQVLKEVNYEYMVMPDHVPQIDGPAPGPVAFAFCFGYIRALMQSLDIHES
jgi:mannonate dehydratase